MSRKLISGNFDGPLFVHHSYRAEDLTCRVCGFKIIRGFRSECFVNVIFQCPKCKFPNDACAIYGGTLLPIYREIVPANALLTETKTYGDANCFVSLEASKAHFNKYFPSNTSHSLLTLDLDAILKLKVRLGSFIGPMLDQAGAKYKNSLKSKSQVEDLFPLHHAIDVLLDYFSKNGRIENPLVLPPKEKHLLAWLVGIEQAFNSFSLCSGFGQAIEDMRNLKSRGFHHTFAVLTAAAMIFQEDFPIAFIDSKSANTRVPDLVTRVSINSKYYFEVKSPKILANFLEDGKPSQEDIFKKLKKTVKDTQINRNHPGTLVIAVSSYFMSALGDAKRMCDNLLETEGRDRPWLEGIMLIKPVGLVVGVTADTFSVHPKAHYCENRHYSGVRFGTPPGYANLDRSYFKRMGPMTPNSFSYMRNLLNRRMVVDRHADGVLKHPLDANGRIDAALSRFLKMK